MLTMHSSSFVLLTLTLTTVLISSLPSHSPRARVHWRIEPRAMWEWGPQPQPQRSQEITPLSVLSERFFILKGFGLKGISNFMFQRAPTVYLPMVDISSEFDLNPNLVAYDPSFIDFPPPPQIPESDGYKTQFVCDYEYIPEEDTGDEFYDYCFYYFYTPKN